MDLWRRPLEKITYVRTYSCFGIGCKVFVFQSAYVRTYWGCSPLKVFLLRLSGRWSAGGGRDYKKELAALDQELANPTWNGRDDAREKDQLRKNRTLDDHYWEAAERRRKQTC